MYWNGWSQVSPTCTRKITLCHFKLLSFHIYLLPKFRFRFCMYNEYFIYLQKLHGSAKTRKLKFSVKCFCFKQQLLIQTFDDFNKSVEQRDQVVNLDAARRNGFSVFSVPFRSSCHVHLHQVTTLIHCHTSRDLCYLSNWRKFAQVHLWTVGNNWMPTPYL